MVGPHLCKIFLDREQVDQPIFTRSGQILAIWGEGNTVESHLVGLEAFFKLPDREVVNVDPTVNTRDSYKLAVGRDGEGQDLVERVLESGE